MTKDTTRCHSKVTQARVGKDEAWATNLVTNSVSLLVMNRIEHVLLDWSLCKKQVESVSYDELCQPLHSAWAENPIAELVTSIHDKVNMLKDD